MLIFEIDALPKLQKGGGVQLIKIKKDDFLSDVTQLTIEDGLEWSTGSKNRKLDDVEFWIEKELRLEKKFLSFSIKIRNLMANFIYLNIFKFTNII